ncbi:c-type cytochrome [Pseudomonas sp. MAP12]|uniref:C-type cytochrome n=1 Tax=Geopseudomonas aromaticivorans TaxID=2849492 RepID=A0ABS6MTV4_9GAMM|nr:c-type cytochrome [Pseudomonas aromaticivorans]MBV2132237.1 c-type cytochrome [Pseudomonas aromaticivorans]
MKGSLVVAAVALLASSSTLADAALELATQKECLSCHSLESISQAPSFKSIAHKYRGQAKVEDRLVSTVMWGSPTYGGYHWGTTKMPTPGSRPRVTQSEASQLVQWILSLK